MRAAASGVGFLHTFELPNSSLQQTPVCAVVFVSALTAVRFKFGGQFEEPVLMYPSLWEGKQGSQFLMVTLSQVRIPRGWRQERG